MDCLRRANKAKRVSDTAGPPGFLSWPKMDWWDDGGIPIRPATRATRSTAHPGTQAGPSEGVHIDVNQDAPHRLADAWGCAAGPLTLTNNPQGELVGRLGEGVGVLRGA